MARRASSGLKEVIRDYRRDQIIDVARRLFGERGIRNVSMDDIATEAGVARSTVYVYFTSREDLVRSCIQRMYGLVREALAATWAAEPSAAARLRGLVRSMLEVVDQSPAFFRLAMAAQTLSDGAGVEVAAELSHIGLEMAELVEELMAQGVAEGIFRPMHPGWAGKLIGQQLFGAMTVRAADPAPLGLDVETDEVFDFLRRALSP